MWIDSRERSDSSLPSPVDQPQPAEVQVRLPSPWADLRCYQPTIRRFAEADPIGLEGTSTATRNIYSYANQNPVRFVDPTGLADINLFPPGSPQSTANNLWNPSGMFSVAGHGNSQYMYGPNGEQLTPADVANMINANANYTSGQDVQLHSCSTGQGSNSFAQQLANLLNAPVTAPNDTQTYHKTTYITSFMGIPVSETPTEFDTIGSSETDASGRNLTFYPQ